MVRDEPVVLSGPCRHVLASLGHRRSIPRPMPSLCRAFLHLPPVDVIDAGSVCEENEAMPTAL